MAQARRVMQARRSAAAAEAAKRQDQALKLSVSGLSFQEIADAVGWKSAGSVGPALERARERNGWGGGPMAEFQQVAFYRLELLTQNLMRDALKGDRREKVSASREIRQITRLQAQICGVLKGDGDVNVSFHVGGATEEELALQKEQLMRAGALTVAAEDERLTPELPALM
jgi:hypothetical protein